MYQTKPNTPAKRKRKKQDSNSSISVSERQLVLHNVTAIAGSVDRTARLQLAKDLFRQLPFKRQLTSPNVWREENLRSR
jgi:hypothetical protein